MPSATIDTVPTWAAWLALPNPERDAFLRAATAYAAASAALAQESAPPPWLPPPVPFAPPACAAMPTAWPDVASPPDAAWPPPADRIGRATIGTADPEAAIPRIGGAALDLAPSPRFMAAAYRGRWRPGAVVRVYCAGSQGLMRLMRRLGLHAYKLGTHAGLDLSLRMRDLNQQRYGSLWQGEALSVDLGFDSWVTEPLNVAAVRPSPGSPVTAGVEAIEVLLPDTMTPEGFDQAVARATCSATLAAFVTSAAGREACLRHGEDERRFVRATPEGASLEWSKEITLVRPRHDVERLVRLCETIIHDHVMAQDLGPIATGGPSGVAQT